MLPPVSLPAAVLLAVMVAALGWLAHALTIPGAIAAAVVGSLVFGFAGWPGAALLLGFFISSSLLSRLFGRRKRRLDEKFSKGSRRDAGQVLANGGIAALAALLLGLLPSQTWLWAGLAGSLAAANADTWATELGVLSRNEPRLITTGRRVEQGTSGAISLVGTLAALAGAALIALLGLTAGHTFLPLPLLALVTAAGLAGSLVDSLLGATLQAIYLCPACQKETERHPLHTCGTPTTQVRGLAWLDNDRVNLACTLTGLLTAGGLALAVPGMFLAPAGPLISKGVPPMTFPLNSSSFEPGGRIPARYTCDGENRSPALSWSDLPGGTLSLALVVEDPDAPGGTFTHWVLYNLPSSVSFLPEGLPKAASLPNGAAQGVNSFQRLGYDGPCPPAGSAHHYFFRLYALDLDPGLPAQLRAGGLRQAIQGHVLGQAEWSGLYSR